MKIEELMNNEEFMAQLREVTNIEEAVKLLAEKGIQVTAAELAAATGDGELDETSLDNVAGGGLISWLISFITPSEKQKAKAAKDMDWAINTINNKHSK